MHKLVHVLASLLFVSNVHCDLPTIKQTSNGPVEGIEQTSVLGETFYAFRGIPYAEPPITGIDPYTGKQVDRRFKAPEPLRRNWTESLKVHDFTDCCIASTHFFQTKTKKSENCLYLNVYIPAGGAEKKTVLVWIRGGAFTEGEANDLLYGPDFLVSEDNIVVIPEYRVGVFGFLNLGFGGYTGNMGLKDQQMALKWIFENIENFSGKKDEILLFGESAGGASVSFHMLNKESRKYFNRAFILSGSAFDYFALSENDHLQRMQDFSKIIEKKELIEYLKTVDSKTLADIGSLTSFGKTLIPPWAPTIESSMTAGAFLTQTLEDVYKSDDAPVLDVMFSFTSQEYITFDPELVRSSEPLLKEDWKESKLQLPFHDFNEYTYPEEYKQALVKLRHAYYPDTNSSEAIKRGNIDLLSDLNFRYGILKNVVLQTKSNNNGTDKTKHRNTFLSRFSVNTELNLFRVLQQIEFSGAAHGEDLCYFLHCQLLDDSKVYENHLIRGEIRSNTVHDIHRRMVKMITNFARTGNPSVENDTPFKSCKSPAEIFCQEISNDAKSSVTADILDQLHYSTWFEIEEMYKKLRSTPRECQGTCDAN